MYKKRARGAEVGAGSEMLSPPPRNKAQERTQPKVDCNCSKREALGSHTTSSLAADLRVSFIQPTMVSKRSVHAI